MDSDTIYLNDDDQTIISSDAKIAIAILLAIICISLYSLEKSGIFGEFFEGLARRYPSLNIFMSDSELNEAQVRRIHSDECSICVMPITNEVGAACGHIFCGKCIIDYWLTRQHRKLNCPLCRKEINMLIRNFNLENIDNNPGLKAIHDNLKYYNAAFSDKRSWRQIIQDAPFYLRRLRSFLTTWEGFVFFLKKLLTSLYVLALVAYIISPLDIIPDFYFVIGWIDDLIALVFLLLYVTVVYYNFLRDVQ